MSPIILCRTAIKSIKGLFMRQSADLTNIYKMNVIIRTDRYAREYSELIFPLSLW
jgi:hypothetical protein